MNRMTLAGRRPILAVNPVGVLALLFCLAGVSGAAWAQKKTGGAESLDDLFDLPATSPGQVVAPTQPRQADIPSHHVRGAEKTKPEALDALFGSEPAPSKGEAKHEGTVASEAIKPSPPVRQQTLSGYYQNELAYAYATPEHWSKFKNTLNLAASGKTTGGLAWKAEGRLVYDPIYDLTSHYSSDVRQDQRLEASVREAYVDFSAGDLDYRLGRQQIVWGEMVGLFFADVVSAKDLREFILSDFQVLRIPQWAARVEYFKEDFHAEAVWIPFPTYNEIGTPLVLGKSGAGSDFYSYPLSPAGFPVIRSEDKPSYALKHGNFGLRLSQLTNGWDISGFYYTSMNSAPTFYRDPVAKNVFTPRHDRIWQVGGTLAKDFREFVLKAEAVYTHGQRYNVMDLADSDGLVKQNTIDWIVGLEFNPASDTRLNTQLYQRIYRDHSPDTIFDRLENGVTFLVNHKFPRGWEAEALWIRSLNRNDWLLRPKLAWRFQPDWRLNVGLDVFHGPQTGLFGQYNDRDRVYTELRYEF